MSRLKIPRHVVTVLEGESLVNDASGLVLYKFAVAAVLTGTFSLFDASVQFIDVAIGGIALGILIGLVFITIHRHLGDVFIEVLASLLIPYVAYVGAESMHVSGVLAVVAAGLVYGRRAPVAVSAAMRILSRSMWNVIVFFTFVIIAVTLEMQGLSLPALVRRMRVGLDRSLQEEQENARNAMSKGAMAAINAMAWQEGISPDLAGRISAEFAEKNAAGDADASVSEDHATRARRLRHAAINAERQALIRL